MIFDIKNLTDNELFTLADKIENEVVIRRKAEVKKIIDNACEALKAVDTALSRTIPVEVFDPFGRYEQSFVADVDLLKLCDALKEYKS